MGSQRGAGPLPNDAARALITRLAADTATIGWSVHAVEKMQQRDVSILQALTVIRSGEIKGDPALDEFGEWRYKLEAVAAGRRVQVIVATDCVQALTVVTVI